jgi:cell wall-associated NlpC family hydrolase
MHKRFISIGVIALIMTTSNAALANVAGDQTPGSNQASAQAIRATQVTIPPTIIGGTPVRVQQAVSGPVKTAALASGPVVKTETPEVGSVEWLAQEKADKDKLQSDAERKQAELEAEISRLEKVARDTKNLNKAIAATKKYVGKTWYALGGSTPDAWDCSGLTMWLYGQLGVTLYHSASVQKVSGDIVTEPKIGDIVAFSYAGHKSAFHVGIYIGPDEMLHAGGKRGDKTEITHIKKWAEGNGNVTYTYTRIVETNN